MAVLTPDTGRSSPRALRASGWWLAGAAAATALAVAALLIETAAMGVVLSAKWPALVLAGAGLILALGAPWVAGGRRVWSAVVALAAAAALARWALLWPLAFHAEDVPIPSGDVRLAGTLFVPRGEGPHPAVVLIHGSGPETRREYEWYGRLFARHGIVALAYDKRGAGASGGRLGQGTYEVLAGDAAAAVALLGGRADVRADAVGLWGISEAEWVAPLVAARGPVAFVVIVSASGMSPADQVQHELEARLGAAGLSPDDVSAAAELNRKLLAYQRTGQGREALQAALHRARGARWFGVTNDFPEQLPDPEEYAWWRAVMDFDPSAAWRRVRSPVLVLAGGADPHLSPERSRRTISDALSASGAPFTFRELPGADHALLEWPLPGRMPPPVFADGHPDGMIAWVREHTTPRRSSVR